MFHRVNPDQRLAVILSFYLTQCSQFRDVACFCFICPSGESQTLRKHVKRTCILTHTHRPKLKTKQQWSSSISSVSSQLWLVFLISEGGLAVCCKHNGIIDLLTALSQAVSSTWAHYKSSPGSAVWGLHTMTAPWSSFTSSFLFFWLWRSARHVRLLTSLVSVFFFFWHHFLLFQGESPNADWYIFVQIWKVLQRKLLQRPLIFNAHPAFQTAGATRAERPESGSWT